MTNVVVRLVLGAAPAAGLALALTQMPAHAQFFDIFNSPSPQYSAPEPEPHYYAPDRVRRYEPPHRIYRRHYRESERRHRRREIVRNAAWNPKQVKGPYQVVVAIGPQEALLYGQKGLIATARNSTGMPGHPTPLGVFTVISKSRWHESNIYSGAPMPWMQRITWSGVAMHEGPRPGYPASHGCIRLPTDFAVRLFHTTKVGARVIVTREAVAPVPIVNSKLFVPKPLETQAAAVSLAARSSNAARPANDPAADPPSANAVAAAADVVAATPDAVTDPPAAIPLPPADPVAQAPKSHAPVSVFVSRKQMKVFVRQGFDELFEMPVTIADPDQPIGTHVYTAMGLTDDGKAMRWTVMSIPSGYRHPRRHVERRHRRGKEEADTPTPAASTASEALGRITLPPQAIAQIDALLKPGSSLIVSDNALSDETDDSTGFIVLTH